MKPRAVATLTVLGLMACGDRTDRAVSPPTPTAPPAPACTLSLPADSDPDGFWQALDHCAPCGGDWSPLWKSGRGEPTDPIAVERILQACGVTCKGSGRDQVIAAFDRALGASAARPWRELSTQCPTAWAPLQAPLHASAPLMAAVLAHRHAPPGAKPQTLPLPLWATRGQGVAAPEAPHARSVPVATSIVSVIGADRYRMTPPVVRWSAAAISVDGGAWPGAIESSPPPADPVTPTLWLGREARWRDLWPALAPLPQATLGVVTPPSDADLGWRDVPRQLPITLRLMATRGPRAHCDQAVTPGLGPDGTPALALRHDATVNEVTTALLALPPGTATALLHAPTADDECVSAP